MFEIRRVRMDDGEILYLLADAETGRPDLYVIRHMFAEIRPSGVSSGTILNRLKGIRVGLTFLRSRNIDIEERIEAGRYLTTEELTALATLCLRRADGKGRLNGVTAASNFSAFVRYFAFRTDELLGFVDRRHHRSIVAARAEFMTRAAAVAPTHRSGATSNERLGLSQEQRELFLRIIRPGDPGNPFQKKLQIRNHAMLLLPFSYGLRAGEEFSLKGVDYITRTDPPTITIHRRPDDKDERRLEPALAKTLGRTLPLDGELRDAMAAWIKERQDRARYPSARKHPYIFVGTDGGPLTLRGARHVYQRLRRVYPELEGLVQHVLRHDC